MSTRNDLTHNNYVVTAGGSVQIQATGASSAVDIQATGSDGTVNIEGAAGAVVSVGTAGLMMSNGDKTATLQGVTKVVLGAGPPGETGAVVELTGTEISITLLKTLVTLTMSPTGIEMKAAETSLKVGVEGVTISGPLIQEKAEAAKKVQTVLEQQQASATRQFQAGVDMIG
ncbi:MAG: hypothetical protein AB7K24_28100 [Gemmataceae bacterium]